MMRFINLIYRWGNWGTIWWCLCRGPNIEQKSESHPGFSNSKVLTLSTQWNFYELSSMPVPPLPSFCLRQLIGTSQQHRMSQRRRRKPHRIPREHILRSCQQHNKQWLITFDFQAPRNVFAKLLIECGSHLLWAGKPSACQGSGSVW